MTTSTIEITDSAYLITLAKSEFDYRQVRQLLSILFAGRMSDTERQVSCGEFTRKQSYELAERFDSLADK